MKAAEERFLRYLSIISEGPLMIVRVPYTRRMRRDGTFSDRSAMPWRHVIRALTAVMRSHGRRLKDVYAVEAMGPEDDTPKFKTEWEATQARLEAAFNGDRTILPAFWLYDWRNDAFVLVRAGKR